MIVSKLKFATGSVLIGLTFGIIFVAALSSKTNAQNTPIQDDVPAEAFAEDVRVPSESCGAEHKNDSDLDKKYEKMFPDGRFHNFGKLPKGTACKHIFRIVNTSNVLIRVDVRSSGCSLGYDAEARYTGQVILQPKEEGKIEVSIAGRYEGGRSGRFYLTMKSRDDFQEFIFLVGVYYEANQEVVNAPAKDEAAKRPENVNGNEGERER